MAKLSKKSKEDKHGKLEKTQEYLKNYNTLAIVENSDIQNQCLQKLRGWLNGKVVFVKKSLLQRKYPELAYKENFFLVFTNEEELEKLAAFEYEGFLNAGDASSANIVISAGLVRNRKLLPFLQPIENKGANSYLLEDYQVISEGQIATNETAEILKIRGYRLAKRRLSILSTFRSNALKEIS